MTTLQSTTLILTLAIASGACQRSSKREDAKSHNNAMEISTATVIEAGSPAKWAMPESMMRHVRDIVRDVRALESSENKDHAALSEKIDGHTKGLISSCTMVGESHEALHDWLMPFMQLNRDYAAAPDTAAKTARLKEIQDSLAAFHDLFE